LSKNANKENNWEGGMLALMEQLYGKRSSDREEKCKREEAERK
jgi:hypothetical protein